VRLLVTTTVHPLGFFTGETLGTLANAPRGSRGYYWDSIFRPERTSGSTVKTYAEIADEPTGPATKVGISQFTRAMLAFLQYRLTNGGPQLFRT
jgi:inosine/xanthosine triphosphate pyrophosphatase family protein